MRTRGADARLSPSDRLANAIRERDWATAAAMCMVTRSHELHKVFVSCIKRQDFIKALGHLPDACHAKAVEAAIGADDALALRWLITSWSKPQHVWALFDVAYQQGKINAAMELMRLDLSLIHI